jgi:hypothetical protein
MLRNSFIYFEKMNVHNKNNELQNFAFTLESIECVDPRQRELLIQSCAEAALGSIHAKGLYQYFEFPLLTL